MGVFLNYVPNQTYLFLGPSLREALENGAKQAFERLESRDPDELLNAAEADVVDELLAVATFEVPDIDRTGAYLDEPQEISQEVRTFVGGRTKQTITRRTLVVPITGPAAFFQMTATTFTQSNGIVAQIDPDNPPNLLLHFDGMGTPEQIKAHFDEQLDLIQERLRWTQADVEAHNTAMRGQIPVRVAARRAKLLEDRNIQASIGFPIKRRASAATYSVPIIRRSIRPSRPASSASTTPYAPEPALADADYEAALKVLLFARDTLERSRPMTSKLGEEDIRHLLLGMLNSHFEGKAGGEVFNCTGKTDILIREQGRNIFIAECKLIDPKHKQSVETVVTGALNQLLGYLTWRDTKAALLLFVRDSDLTTVVSKAVDTIGRHPNYKRDGQITNDDRQDVVLHANGDQNREIRMAFLPIHVGGVHDQPAE